MPSVGQLRLIKMAAGMKAGWWAVILALMIVYAIHPCRAEAEEVREVGSKPAAPRCCCFRLVCRFPLPSVSPGSAQFACAFTGACSPEGAAACCQG